MAQPMGVRPASTDTSYPSDLPQGASWTLGLLILVSPMPLIPCLLNICFWNGLGASGHTCAVGTKEFFIILWMGQWEQEGEPCMPFSGDLSRAFSLGLSTLSESRRLARASQAILALPFSLCPHFSRADASSQFWHLISVGVTHKSEPSALLLAAIPDVLQKLFPILILAPQPQPLQPHAL